MGCDIHAYGEELVKGLYRGQEIEVARDYLLFSFLAGVRNDRAPRVNDYIEPRGFGDITPSGTTMDASVLMGEDGHTHSFLSIDELREIVPKIRAFEDRPNEDYTEQTATALERIISHMEDYRQTRLVFFFDN